MSPFVVIAMDDYQGVVADLGPWSDLGDDVELVTLREHVADRSELVHRLSLADAVLCIRERTALPSEVLAALPKLKLVITAGMANSMIDMVAARDLGITVCGTSGALSATPELTWALIFAAARQLPVELDNVRQGRWQSTVGTDLFGATLGLVGLGSIGQQVARQAAAFGMRVIAWSPHLTPERAAGLPVEVVSKHKLFSTSDFVSLHLRLGETSRNIVGAEDIRSMKSTAYLINTSRSGLIDQDGLFNALMEGRIAGAALDVYDEEPPPPDDRWRNAPRCMATPHLGFVTMNSYRTYFKHAVEDVRAFLDGSPVRVINAATDDRSR